VITREPEGLVLLAVIGLLSAALYRGYHVQRLRYGRLDLLYQFTRSVDEAVGDETVIETIVGEAKNLLRAQHAQVVLVPRTLDDPPPWWAEACDGAVLRVERAGRQPIHESLRRTGHTDGMAAPLRDGGRVTGVLLVMDRLDNVSTFDSEDARLFEALAGHASVALTNAGLVDRVRAAAAETEHLSLHDHLTGLPNRVLLEDRMDQAELRAARQPGYRFAILLLDLDGFKAVNDTLGHAVGDLLLIEVARRLTGLLRKSDTVARLGGDEFVILLDGVNEHQSVIDNISVALSAPFFIDGERVQVGCSVGVAVSGEGGSDPDHLLREADAAMYRAKSAAKRSAPG